MLNLVAHQSEASAILGEVAGSRWAKRARCCLCICTFVIIRPSCLWSKTEANLISKPPICRFRTCVILVLLGIVDACFPRDLFLLELAAIYLLNHSTPRYFFPIQVPYHWSHQLSLYCIYCSDTFVSLVCAFDKSVASCSRVHLLRSFGARRRRPTRNLRMPEPRAVHRPSLSLKRERV